MARSFMFPDSPVGDEPRKSLPATHSRTPANLDNDLLDCSLAFWRALDGGFRLIVDPVGTLLRHEAVFFELRNAGRDFEVRGGKIVPRDRRMQYKFETLIRGDRATSTLLIPKSNRDGHWICRAGRLRDNPSEPVIGICIRAAGDDVRTEWADFVLAFGLTVSEDRVLHLMMSGESPQAIADRDAVSINTIRTHLRHIHEKLDVSDLHQLWRRVNSYRLG